MQSKNNQQGGLVKFIVIIIVIVLLLSLFRVNLRGFVDDTSTSALQNNITLVENIAVTIWVDYIKNPVQYVWNGYIVPFFKGEFLSGLGDKVRERSTLPPE